jgi:futalosine hydrolase
LETALSEASFDRVMDIGIAGSYRPDLPIGSVVQVTVEQYGDRPGAFLSNLDPWPELSFLPQATGNTVTALEERFRQVDADVESMEGAAVFESCLAAGVLFAEIRAVSNLVGETDHSRWDIPLALERLEAALRMLFDRLDAGSSPA